jgi:aspartate/methionine/tyrosine aminotransferase
MNPLAAELNEILEGTVAGRLFSNLGKRLYFPKGIIAQSAEAKKSASFANGTIGMACKNGKPLILSAIAGAMPSFTPEETVAYAPTAGIEKARTAWRDQMIQKNPSLDPSKISLPAVIAGLTAGLSCTADLFIGKGSSLIASDPCWDNYSLIFETRRQAHIVPVQFLGKGPGLDIGAISAAVRQEAKSGTVRIIFNFPNNPSGYSATTEEADSLVRLLLETAENGADVLVICDDAYYGLFYEDDISKESLFAKFANLHERILAIKLDGPTKEDYVWGLRMGFLTFGSKGLYHTHYDALVKKLMGAIRSSVSCSNTSAQHLMLKVMEDSRTPGEKAEYRAMLQRRYNLVKEFLAAHPGHPVLQPMPFNSGYFMSFRCKTDAEAIRQELLQKHGIGVISLGKHCLRVAFSSIDEEKIAEVYGRIYDTAMSLS